MWTAELNDYYNSSLDDEGWKTLPDFMSKYGIDYFSFTPSIQLKTYNSEFN